MDSKSPKVDAPEQSEANGQRDSSPLRTYLVDRYGDLKSRLARRLGSSDWAEDALQDTYLRLDGFEAVSRVHNPGAYLLRTAFNVALNQRRTDSWRLSSQEADSLMYIADDAPDALRMIEGRSDIERLTEIMGELPPRARDILLAVRLDGLSRTEIAERFGISVSMVEKELRRAQEHCTDRFRQDRTKT